MMIDPANASLVELLARADPEMVAAIRKELGEAAWDALAQCWPARARPAQLQPPGDWRVWLVMAGRGFGKTRAGAEWVHAMAKAAPRLRIALVGASHDDVRGVMIEGESGLLAIAPDGERPLWNPALRRLLWRNGSMATCYSAAEPEGLRGPQHHLPAGQAQKEVTHNEALVLIDSLIAPLVEGVGTASPPPAATVGQAWIVGPAPTGAWVGKAGQLAVFSAGGWRFVDLPVGASVCERATLGQWRRGATAWIAPPLCAAPSGGATVDEGARNAIAAIVAALVTHGLAAGA